MRFMIIRKADKDTESGAMPSQQLFTDMLGYNGERLKTGAFTPKLREQVERQLAKVSAKR